jgi:hypothetical protein
MLLAGHIIIALAGLAVSTWSLFQPSQTKIRNAYWLTLATIASGTYLVISLHQPMLSSCVAGLSYTGVVLVLTTSAKYRLAKITRTDHND